MPAGQSFRPSKFQASAHATKCVFDFGNEVRKTVSTNRIQPNHLTSDETSALAELKGRLEALVGGSLVQVVLFGSKARGDYGEDSDLDLAVIVRGLDRALKRAILDVVADVELHWLIPMSTLVLSEKEFFSLLERERQIAREIQHEGIRI